MSKRVKMWHRKDRGIKITRLMARDGSDCTLCGEHLDRHIKDEHHPMYVTFDHIIPESEGGLDSLDNLQLAHQVCNNKRGCVPVEQYVA